MSVMSVMPLGRRSCDVDDLKPREAVSGNASGYTGVLRRHAGIRVL